MGNVTGGSTCAGTGGSIGTVACGIGGLADIGGGTSTIDTFPPTGALLVDVATGWSAGRVSGDGSAVFTPIW